VRERYIAESGGEEAFDDLFIATGVAQSIRGADDERAWELRRRLLEVVPSPALWSLDGLLGDEAWEVRQRFVTQAPKIVLRTFDGVDHPRAWELRERHAPRVKEAVDSMIGLDNDEAWAIREECVDIWPSTVVKTINQLIFDPRGVELAERMLAKYPSNISLLKHVTRATERLEAGPEERGE
jgi:dTMP kinase